MRKRFNNTLTRGKVTLKAEKGDKRAYQFTRDQTARALAEYENARPDVDLILPKLDRLISFYG